MRGTLLLLLLLPCLCSCLKNCRSGVHENTDFPGNDIKFVYAPDVNHCQWVCTQHPTCKFFTFFRSDWTQDNRNFYCYLKQTASGNPTKEVTLQGVTSGYSLQGCLQGRDCHLKLETNKLFTGTDIKYVTASDAAECQRLCTKDASCLFFAYFRSDWTQDSRTSRCYFRKSASGQPFREKKRQGVTSGFSLKPCYKNADHCFDQSYQDVDFPGCDYKSLVMDTVEACQKTCTDDPSCQFFTWVTDSYPTASIRKQCYLKTILSLPAPPKVVKMTNMASGFPQRCSS